MAYDLYENKGPQVAGVAAAFLTLSWIAIGMRIYCRLAIVKSFGIDDYLAVIAQLMFTCFCSFCITGVHYGTGQHAAVIPPANLVLGLKWWWFCEPFYVISNLTLKFSIGIFLLRIAVMKTQKYILIGVICMQALYSTYYFFLFVFQCLPVRYFWTQYTGDKGSCLNADLIVDSTYAYAGISCLTDWTYGLLPVWMIWDLQMNSRTKLTVGVILAFAAIGSTATIVRFPYVKGLRDTADFLYATTGVAIWSTAETGIGIIASAVATLRPLFRNILGRNNFLGAASSGGTRKWTSKMTPSSAGYVKSTSRTGNAEIGLRSDIGQTGGITTTCHGSPFDSTEDVEMGNTSRPRKDSQNQLRPQNGWGAEKLRDDSSDEFPLSPPQPDWGIRKTMVVQTIKSDS